MYVNVLLEIFLDSALQVVVHKSNYKFGGMKLGKGVYMLIISYNSDVPGLQYTPLMVVSMMFIKVIIQESYIMLTRSMLIYVACMHVCYVTTLMPSSCVGCLLHEHLHNIIIIVFIMAL